MADKSGILTLADLPGIYEQLSADLPKEAIERTKGAVTGKKYDTTGYGYQFIVNRMNEVLGLGHWREYHVVTDCEEYQTKKGRTMYAVAMDITVEIGNWIDGGFQILAQASSFGGHDSLVKADALKGSQTNGLKKTLAFFGVGRRVYEGTVDDDNKPVPERGPKKSTTPMQAKLAERIMATSNGDKKTAIFLLQYLTGGELVMDNGEFSVEGGVRSMSELKSFNHIKMAGAALDKFIKSQDAQDVKVRGFLKINSGGNGNGEKPQTEQTAYGQKELPDFMQKEPPPAGEEFEPPKSATPQAKRPKAKPAAESKAAAVVDDDESII